MDSAQFDGIQGASRVRNHDREAGPTRPGRNCARRGSGPPRPSRAGRRCPCPRRSCRSPGWPPRACRTGRSGSGCTCRRAPSGRTCTGSSPTRDHLPGSARRPPRPGVTGTARPAPRDQGRAVRSRRLSQVTQAPPGTGGQDESRNRTSPWRALTMTGTPVVFIHGLWLHATSWEPGSSCSPRPATTRSRRAGPAIPTRWRPPGRTRTASRTTASTTSPATTPAIIDALPAAGRS